MAHSCPPPGQRKRNHFSGIPTVFISISFFCNVTVCYSCEVAFFFPFCNNDTHESIFSITCFCVDVVSIIEFTYEGLRKLPQFIECVLFFPLISLICFHYQLSRHLPEASVAQNNIGLLWKINTALATPSHLPSPLFLLSPLKKKEFKVRSRGELQKKGYDIRNVKAILWYYNYTNN